MPLKFPFLQQVGEWFRNQIVILNKLMIISSEPDKSSQLFDRGWCSQVKHRLDCFLIVFYSFFWDNVTEILKFTFTKFTLSSSAQINFAPIEFSLEWIYTSILSKETRMNLRWWWQKIKFLKDWKLEGTLHNPNSIIIYIVSTKDYHGMSRGWTWSLWYPAFKSSLVKTVAVCNSPNMSSTVWIGNLSLIVAAFRGQ